MINQAEKILIVDPEDASRRDLERYLTDKGYYVSSLSDRADTAALIFEQNPEIVFVSMPAPRIRALVDALVTGGLSVPVVSYTDATSADAIVETLRAGAADVVLKPFHRNSGVDDVLHRLLERVRLGRLNQRYRQELEDANNELKAGITELRADHAAGLKVQMKMLPDHGRIFDGICFDHQIKPSLYLSGDFLDYFSLDSERMMFYIADVSGHGASSAFVTVLLKNLTNRLQRNLRRGSSDELSDPARFLSRVNTELLDAGLGKHVTMFVGVYHSPSHWLDYAVGAHFPMPILVRGNEAAFLEGSGLPIGLFNAAEYQAYSLALPEDFALWLFSDGILEVIDAPDLNAKEEVLLDLVKDRRQTIAALSEALGLNQVAELPDDIAVLCVSGRVSGHV